ncbi:NAD(P)-dependent oxidoreductase [Candidatus Nomurabacteria bacterium]|nr:NAD(P)-dependent oxidoreductase [Candidatus Nomurabacteria bacterium]
MATLLTPKTILITGATGYLGSNLTRRLLEEDGHTIVAMKRSFSNTHRVNDVSSKIQWFNLDDTELSDVFAKYKFDVVIHCATDYGRKEVNPLQIIEANLILPLRLLELANNNNVPVFINTDTMLDKRISHYSLSKKHFREWMAGYDKKMVLINMVLSHFYGPGDDPTKFVSFIKQQLEEEVPSIPLTKGEQIRDFVYIDDIVEAFMVVLGSIAERKAGMYEFQVCGGSRISIKELVTTLKEMLKNKNTKLDFGSLPYREFEVMDEQGDNSDLSALGWQAKYKLREGLSLLIGK